MITPPRWLRQVLGRPFALLLTLLTLAGMAGLDSRPERALRNGLFDTWQRVFPRERVNDSVVVIAIDDRSLADLGQWPWPRTQMAQLVQRLAAEAPAAIAIDAFFAEPDRLSPPLQAQQLRQAGFTEAADALARLPDSDAQLAAALAAAPVVLGVGALEVHPGLAPTIEYRTAIQQVGGEATPHLRRYAAALRSIDLIDRGAAGHGVMNNAAEEGTVRRIPALVAIGDDLLPGLAAETLRLVSGMPVLRVRVGQVGIREVGVGDWVIPTDRNGEWWLHFSDPEERPHVSAAAVLRGELPDGVLAGRIALLGYTALGLQDNVVTPLGSMPGVEVHAEAMENALDGRLLRRPHWAAWAESGLLAVLSLAAILMLPRTRASRALAALAAGIVLALAGSTLVFLRLGWLLDAASPAVTAGAVFAAALAATLARAEAQRRRLHEQLAASREAQARMEGELDAARRIQMGMLPVAQDVFREEPRVDVATLMQPARTVGGDLYDFFMLDASRLFFLVGDVSGKGLPSSLFMALAKAMTKAAALTARADPGQALSSASSALAQENPEQLFVTMVACVLDLDSGELAWCSAGHEAPWLLGGPGAEPAALCDAGGPPLCVIDGFAYRAERTRLARGATLCLVTDGVSEAQNRAGEFFGPARLLACLRRAGASKAPEHSIVEAIRDDVAAFVGDAELADDLTVLALRWSGPRRDDAA